MEPFVGEIRAFAFGMIPRGWHLCDGATLQVQQNQALYALIGTLYGGDGKTTFKLPDLRGRVPVCYGNSVAGQTYQVGATGGSEGVVLTANQVPPHAHTLYCSNANATTNVPAGNVPAAVATGTNIYADAETAPAYLAPGTVVAAGQSTAHDNMQPTLAVSFCIATTGYFPPRQ